MIIKRKLKKRKRAKTHGFRNRSKSVLKSRRTKERASLATTIHKKK